MPSQNQNQKMNKGRNGNSMSEHTSTTKNKKMSVFKSNTANFDLAPGSNDLFINETSFNLSSGITIQKRGRNLNVGAVDIVSGQTIRFNGSLAPGHEKLVDYNDEAQRLIIGSVIISEGVVVGEPAPRVFALNGEHAVKLIKNGTELHVLYGPPLAIS